MGALFSLSKSATSIALDTSEIVLLLFGVLLTVGLIGEYAKSERWKRHVKTFEMLVIIGVAGELLADGGIFLFSSHLQTIADSEVAELRYTTAGLNKAASEAKLEQEKLRASNLELEQLIQPRELTDEQQKAISQALRRFSGKSVFLRTYSFDQESMRLSTLLDAALKSGGIDVQFAPTPSPLILPVGINVTGSDKSFVDAIKHALSSEGKLDLTDPKWKPTQVGGGVFVGAYSPKEISADIFVGAKPFSVAATALALAQQVGEYAAPRTISDEQAKLIRTCVGSSLNGHTLTIQANPDEAEIWTFANGITSSFGMMKAKQRCGRVDG